MYTVYKWRNCQKYRAFKGCRKVDNSTVRGFGDSNMTNEERQEILTAIENCPICKNWDPYLLCSVCEEDAERLEEKDEGND